MYIFLDDERMPKDVKWIEIPCCVEWTIVRNIDQFKEQIKAAHMFTREGVTHISFDHDLADLHYGGNYNDERTGMDCAKWLVEYCIDSHMKLPSWTVHSLNPIGSDNINKLLLNFKKHELNIT